MVYLVCIVLRAFSNTNVVSFFGKKKIHYEKNKRLITISR
mgnify:CR=1 FL=1